MSLATKYGSDGRVSTFTARDAGITLGEIPTVGRTVPDDTSRTSDGAAELFNPRGNQCKVVGSFVWDQCEVWMSSLVGFSGPTWMVNGPNTWEAAEDCMPGRTMIDGLVA